MNKSGRAMKSIRVSLIVYFLSLLVLGLGGVSLLAYRSAADTLHDKEVSNRSHLESEYLTRAQDLNADFDAHLLNKARKLLNRVNRPNQIFLPNMMTVMNAPAVPFGYLNAVTQLRFASSDPRFGMIFVRPREPRTLDQHVAGSDDLGPSDEQHSWEASATFYRDGKPWESTHNLAASPFTLDERQRETVDWKREVFDDVKVGALTLRRVTIKAPPRRMFGPPFNQGSGGSNPFGKGGRPQPPNNPPPPPSGEPFYYLQFAIDSGPHQQQLQRLVEERDARLARLTEETTTSLADLRRRLFGVCSLTALSVLVGGLILIWMGLAPLNRLSDAVSQINERDFQLPLDPKSLPTELQPVAERLRHSLEQLKRAFAREKQAAQDISHDLRTPLAALTTTLEVALKKDRTGAEYREMIEECQMSASQMSHLVERLLTLAKVDSGSNPVKLRPIDLAQAAQYAMDLVRPLAKARSITMSLDAPAELPMLADRDKVCEVLTNLLHNAVDYNRDGGTIDVSVRQHDGSVEIRVEDSGIGIASESLDRLFERFYRADPSRASDTPHCGLGLAIVKSYVELMRGSIAVDSRLGEGTTFRIRLPYVGPGEQDEAEQTAPAAEVYAS